MRRKTYSEKWQLNTEAAAPLSPDHKTPSSIATNSGEPVALQILKTHHMVTNIEDPIKLSRTAFFVLCQVSAHVAEISLYHFKVRRIFVDFIQKFTEIRGRAITRVLLKISRKFADKLQMSAAIF